MVESDEATLGAVMRPGCQERRQKRGTEQAQPFQGLHSPAASLLTAASGSTRQACLKGPQWERAQTWLANRIMAQKGCLWHLLMTGRQERGSVQLFQKKIEIQCSLEKVEDRGQFQPASNTGYTWGGEAEMRSNTGSEMKGLVTFLDGVTVYCY